MTNDIKEIFSHNLNRIMKTNNKTQVNLIDDLGLNKSTISAWCNGAKMPRMNAVHMLANYFKVDVSDLLEKKENSVTNIPKDCILLARKIGDVPEEKREKVINIIDSTIDNVLAMLEKEDS